MKSQILSLFCGAGGLDLGFENAGFSVGLAYDINEESVSSYNKNRHQNSVGISEDVRKLSVERFDKDYGGEFQPVGVIGGPPCQSFSRANTSVYDPNDPRHTLSNSYANLIKSINNRSPLHFFVLENVPEFSSGNNSHRFKLLLSRLDQLGFEVSDSVVKAVDHGVPQKRVRLFVIGINRELYPNTTWHAPDPGVFSAEEISVESAIGNLPEPRYFERNLSPQDIPHHPNHWCMKPKSKRFLNKELTPGYGGKRSFKTLSWSKPSYTVAYGNREVHVHPNCHRRLSVFEAMLLQGFPPQYILEGNLSSQINQVSEAVPPPLAEAIANSIATLLEGQIKIKASESCQSLLANPS
ncbi:MAG: DNA cytosine methyltransferase [Rhodospirillales bacterium]|nr:DNA cytosine methyltransferase [Rhodospirillales bacterium]